ncbi:hypothetical protein L484_013164 [Morus notabilis]|uniref:Uncharacterized protein n=2 Tax=Morus notabilis TaxID=981085 RepID=W9RBN5_9ROSA|nr:hypothetical protein L484_013164 [Morus notabilis]
MVPAQNLSKQNHLLQYHKGSTNIDITSALCDYNYGRGNIDEVYTTERCGGESIMSRKSQGYEYCSTDQSSCVVGSDILVIGDHHLHHHQYPILMADDQDESRTNSLNNDAPSSNSNKELEGGAGAGAGPGAGAACGGQDQERDHHHDHHGHDHDDREGWLQLSIGGHTGNLRQENKIHHHHHHHRHDIQVLEPMSTARRGGGTGLNTIELDLLPGGGGGGMRSTGTTTFEGPSISTTHEYQHQNVIGGLNIAGRGSSMSNFGSGTNFSTPSLMYFQQYYPGSSSTSTSDFPQYHQADHQALNNWAFRPLIPQQYQQQQYAYASSSSSSSSSSSTSSSLLMPQLGSTTTSYLARQFQLQPPVVDAAPASAGPTVDFRVVNPPRRPHSGIWFMLQASQNQ